MTHDALKLPSRPAGASYAAAAELERQLTL
jgi:hypothetical protein